MAERQLPSEVERTPFETLGTLPWRRQIEARLASCVCLDRSCDSRHRLPSTHCGMESAGSAGGEMGRNRNGDDEMPHTGEQQKKPICLCILKVQQLNLQLFSLPAAASLFLLELDTLVPSQQTVSHAMSSRRFGCAMNGCDSSLSVALNIQRRFEPFGTDLSNPQRK